MKRFPWLIFLVVLVPISLGIWYVQHARWQPLIDQRDEELRQLRSQLAPKTDHKPQDWHPSRGSAETGCWFFDGKDHLPCDPYDSMKVQPGVPWCFVNWVEIKDGPTQKLPTCGIALEECKHLLKSNYAPDRLPQLNLVHHDITCIQ